MDGAQPCAICGDVVPESINCDVCHRSRHGVEEELTDELYEALRTLGQDFPWDCTDCNLLTLPQQLIPAGYFTHQELHDIYGCAPQFLTNHPRPGFRGQPSHADVERLRRLRSLSHTPLNPDSAPEVVNGNSDISASADMLPRGTNRVPANELSEFPVSGLDHLGTDSLAARQEECLPSTSSGCANLQDSHMMRSLAKLLDNQQRFFNEQQRMLLDYQQRQEQERRSELTSFLLAMRQSLPQTIEPQMVLPASGSHVLTMPSGHVSNTEIAATAPITDFTGTAYSLGQQDPLIARFIM